MAKLDNDFQALTGLRYNISELVESASTPEEKQKVYNYISWNIKKGRIMEKETNKALEKAIMDTIKSLNQNSTIDDVVETYTAEEAAAHNAQLPGAKTTNDWKVEPVEAQEAVEAQPAIYSFESYDSQAKTTKYGEGKVEVIEMRAGGATIEVTENTSTDPNAEDFVGQQFNIATGLATEEPIQLYTLQNEPVDIWVTVALVSEAVEAQEAVEAVEGVKYTQEEADAYNATLDGAVKEGDVKE